MEDFADLANIEQYINNLCQMMSKWTNDMKSIISITFELANGSIVDEINFWMSMERSTILIQKQIEYPETQITLEILKQVKKFSITVPFAHDNQFSAHYIKTKNINSCLKEFPINDLLTAVNVGEIKQALIQIFLHIKKLSKVPDYS